jgi:hypothetical protein
MHLMTEGCSIKEMTFMCPPHFGHFKASMFQAFLRSTAHICLLRLEYEERSFMAAADFSSPGAFGKIP